jgi:subtilisin family serine protease
LLLFRINRLKKEIIMKRISLILIALLNAIVALAQTNFIYTSSGEKTYFNVHRDKIVLKTTETTETGSIVGQIACESLVKVKNQFFIASIDTLETTLQSAEHYNGINYIEYMLEYSDGTLQTPDNKIFVKCKQGQTIEQIINVAGLSENIVAIEMINTIDKIYTITFSANLKDVISIANLLFETNLCEFAEPSFIRFIKPFNPHYPNQWGLNNTGQNNGVANNDIKAVSAWGISQGNANINIAVIDEGVDLTHPDLVGNLLPGFDATSGAPSGANGSMAGNDAHGTSCAGIIAAVDNNIGIIGVAPNCGIIPVRVAYNVYYFGDQYWLTEDSWLVNGIHHAWNDLGADVLSNSWGGGNPSATIHAEIQNAITMGRNGLGCIVVFAAGNNNTDVSYPASHPNVIAVGAISPCGERKSPSSCDEEILWGSNYGTNLDVVAPGVLIPTTDIQGSAGYNTASGTTGNYVSNFNGTSAACPHVSGVAALILSVRPDLTQAQVRSIIESTAQKAGGYNYQTTTGRPNGTWHEEMGYGLVDAYAALNAVIISGSSTICATPATYTLSPGTTTSWSVEPTNAFSITSQNTRSAVVKALSYNNTPGTLTAIVSGIGVTTSFRSCSLTASLSISGPSEICTSATFTITPANLPIESATWQYSSNIFREFNKGGNSSGTSIVLTKGFIEPDLIQQVYPLPTLPSVPSTYGWVGATIQINGVNYTVSPKTVTVGTPQATILGAYTNPISLVPIEPTQAGSYYFRARNIPSTVSSSDIRWLVAPRQSTSGASTQFYLGKSISAYIGQGQYEIRLQWTSNCGNSFPSSRLIGSAPMSVLSAVSPNPAASTLYFDIDEEAPVVELSGGCTVQLRSVQTGTLALSQTISNFQSDFSIDVSAVPDGLYSLTLSQGNTIVHSGTILIQH